MLLGGIAAGAAATVKPESASAGFGFGERIVNEKDYGFSPYSLLGGSMDKTIDPGTLYNEYGPDRVARAREQMANVYGIFEKLRPEIENKHYTTVKKKTTLEAGTLRTNLDYMYGASGYKPDINDLRQKIIEQLDYITVDNRVKKTAETLKDYDTLMPLFKEFIDRTNAI